MNSHRLLSLRRYQLLLRIIRRPYFDLSLQNDVKEIATNFIFPEDLCVLPVSREPHLLHQPGQLLWFALLDVR